MSVQCPEIVASLSGGSYQCKRRANHPGAHSPIGDPTMDVPFERQPQTQLDLADGHLASGLVVMAGTLPLLDGGTAACLVYRFANPDGSGFYPPMILACDNDQLQKTTDLTASAVAAAIEAAS